MCFTPHLETDYLKPFIEKSNVWLISFFTLSIICSASSIKQVLWSGRKNFFSHPLFFFQQVQYKFCYEITRLFVDSYSDYANFRWWQKSSSNFHFNINVWNVQVHFYELNSNFTSNWLLSDMTSRRCIYNSTFKPKVSARACCFFIR